MARPGPIRIRVCDGGCLLRLRVKPKASRDAILGSHDGLLKISVKEPPEKGKANRGVRRFLADLLGVPLTAMTIVSGETSHDKTVRIAGLEPAECRRRLELILP